MWVTQTYLGVVEPDAKLFVYYFFEDYNSEQRKFTERVQRELEKLGELYGGQVALMMPGPRAFGKVESEIRGKNAELWFSLREKLPGLFLSRKPFTTLEKNDDGYLYIPFEGTAPARAASVIRKVRGLVDKTLEWDLSHPPEKIPRSLVREIWDAIEIKPGIWGLKIDLKKLLGS